MTLVSQPEWVAQLVEILGRQREIYRQLHELSQQQGDLVHAGDAEPLLALLGQRQTLIDQLTHINGQLEPFKQDWATLWGQLDTPNRQNIQQIIDDVQRLLDGIMAQDERDRQSLMSQRDEVSADLRQVHRGTAVNKAYGKTMARPVTNRYTDQQG